MCPNNGEHVIPLEKLTASIVAKEEEGGGGGGEGEEGEGEREE